MVIDIERDVFGNGLGIDFWANVDPKIYFESNISSSQIHKDRFPKISNVHYLLRLF